MFEYQNEHYENRNQMYNYNGMPENGLQSLINCLPLRIPDIRERRRGS